MKAWVMIILVAAVIFSLIIISLAGADISSQQIVSNDFTQNDKGLYVSPEINLLFKSQGTIQWGTGHNDTHFYLVPASQMSKVNQTLHL